MDADEIRKEVSAAALKALGAPTFDRRPQTLIESTIALVHRAVAEEREALCEAVSRVIFSECPDQISAEVEGKVLRAIRASSTQKAGR